MEDSRRIAEVMEASPYFRELPRACIGSLASRGRPRTYAHDSLVHAPGMLRPAFLLVMSGSLRLACPSTHPGRPRTLAVLEKGSFHNVDVALGTAEAHCEAHAFGATEVAAFSRSDLRNAARDHPRLDGHLKRMAVSRMNAVISAFADLTSEPLERRLARRLLSQSMARDRDPEIHGTRAMLAEMLRAGRTRVTAMLKDWERRGLLRLGYRRLVLRNLTGIREIAQARIQPF